MLSFKGKIAFIIPAEIMQVAYAEDLRLFLSKQLSRITLLTFKKLIFPEIEQEVVVLIGEKGGEEKGIRIVEISDLDELSTLSLASNGYQKVRHVKEKWIKYFISGQEANTIQMIKNDSRFVSFDSLGIINIGITTGNNNYFSLDQKRVDQYDLKDVCLPLIGRSAHAQGIYFTETDWKQNLKKGKNAWLLNFPDEPCIHFPDKHKDYIVAMPYRQTQCIG